MSSSSAADGLAELGLSLPSPTADVDMKDIEIELGEMESKMKEEEKKKDLYIKVGRMEERRETAEAHGCIYLDVHLFAVYVVCCLSISLLLSSSVFHRLSLHLPAICSYLTAKISTATTRICGDTRGVYQG